VSAFLLAARRTAVVPRGGAFAALEIHQLAAPVIAAVLADAGLEAGCVEELILGNALGAGGNPARLAALAAGLPEAVAGLSIDRQCAGGLDALRIAAAMVEAGQAEVVLAGGVESYSRRPLRLRTFADGRSPEPYEQPNFAPDPARDVDMAEAADALGRALGISRADQDAWAIRSHARALAAGPCAGIVPLAGIRQDPFARVLSAGVAARAARVTGEITAANAAVAADGAAVCVVVSERVAAGCGLRIAGSATLGADPMEPGIAPLAAIEAALRAASIGARYLSVAEIMEAYAVQALACIGGAGIDPEIVNLGGGALARGHPIGASGAVLAVRLFHEMQVQGGTGLAAIAAAGGLGSALVLRSESVSS